MKFETKPLSAGLYFVATPIGSARDITLRALDVLASADVLAAEDTRTARKLLEIHGVPLAGRQVLAYHDHSNEGVRNKLTRAITEGQSVAYVSEAGTPLVADPGYALGRAAIAAGLPVIAVPGATAAIAALTVSGLPTDRFAFLGFLSPAKSQRQTALAEIAEWPMTVIIYESAKRINQLFADVCEVMGGEREAVICRELTKRFEEVRRGTAATLLGQLPDLMLKGEFVVLLGPSTGGAASSDDVRAALQQAMGAHRMKDAATLVAGAYGLPRRDVYQMALELKNEEDDSDATKGDQGQDG